MPDATVIVAVNWLAPAWAKLETNTNDDADESVTVSVYPPLGVRVTRAVVDEPAGRLKVDCDAVNPNPATSPAIAVTGVIVSVDEIAAPAVPLVSTVTEIAVDTFCSPFVATKVIG